MGATGGSIKCIFLWGCEGRVGGGPETKPKGRHARTKKNEKITTWKKSDERT